MQSGTEWRRQLEERAAPSKMSRRRSEEQRMFRKIVRRFETQNTVLLGYDVFHHVVQSGNAPAWSAGTDIYFNAGKLPSPDSHRNIAVLTGVNNHELAHVMYTPTYEDMHRLWRTYGTPPMVDALRTRPLYGFVFNMLEDQRIEMMKIARHDNQRPYFVSMFVAVYVRQASAETKSMAYLLARGRRFLPIKLRRRLKRHFKAQAMIPDARRIIDEYITLNLLSSEGMHRAHVLIEEMIALGHVHDIWPKDKAPEASDMCCGGIKEFVSASQIKAKSAKAAAKDASAVAAMLADEAAEKAADGLKTPDKGQGKGDTEDAADNDADGDASDSDDSGKGAGAGRGSDRDLEEAADSAEKDALSGDLIEHELNEAREYIRTAFDLDMAKVRNKQPVPEELPPLVRRVANEFRKLESDVDPYWETRVTSGKLNPSYAMMHPNDREHSFRRWQDGGLGGQDQEWVVLLDCSDSMSKHLDTLGRVGWVLKHAADLMEITMTVIAYGFAGHPHLVYGPNQRADATEAPVLPNLGGTLPGTALVSAHAVFSQSNRAVKGMLVMTDGSWHHTSQDFHDTFRSAEEVIDSINGMGVHTHLVFMGDTQRVDPHHCQTSSAISTVEELPMLMRDLMIRLLAKSK